MVDEKETIRIDVDLDDLLFDYKGRYILMDKTLIQKYIEEQDASLQPRLFEIYEAIKTAIPDTEERLSWGMPTFWRGRNIIHFAPAKRHIGIYPGPDAIEAFAGRLTEYKTSKGAIQLPHNKDLPLELIAEIAKWSFENNKR